MPIKAYWEQIYASKSPTEVSGLQPHAERSLRLIRTVATSASARIIDVGGGASTSRRPAGHGLPRRHGIGPVGPRPGRAQARLGARAREVRWIEANVLPAALPRHGDDVWHDRAVFHFLTDPADRHAYVRQVLHAVRPGGQDIIATFAPDGPERCSGRPVMRYDPAGLHAEFGTPFGLLRHEREAQHTPAGKVQPFICLAARRPTTEVAINPSRPCS